MLNGLEKLLLSKRALASHDDHWYYSRDTIKTDTPSRQRGMSYEMELKIRRDGIRFLQFLDEGSFTYVKKYNPETLYNKKIVSTAAVWFHRFFMIHPLQIFDRYEIAAACFHLASKAEDQPHSLSSLSVYTVHMMKLLEEPSVNDMRPADMEEDLKVLENILIETLGFMVCVRHPYTFNNLLAQELLGTPEELQQVSQLADQFWTESLGSVVCLTTDPKKLSIAHIIWACKQLNVPLDNWKGKKDPQLKHWCESFKLRLSDVDRVYQEYEVHKKLNSREHAAVVALLQVPVSNGFRPKKPSPFHTVMTMKMFCNPSKAEGKDDCKFGEPPKSKKSLEIAAIRNGRAES